MEAETDARERIRQLLSEGRQAFSQSEIGKLRTAGKHLSTIAFLDSDPQMVNASACLYSLSKFLEKPHIVNDPKWAKYRQAAQDLLDRACASQSQEELATLLQQLLSQCDEVSELLGRFHTSATEKARLKIAADFYARGASLGTAALLAGADKSGALSYIGATRITDKYETIPVAQRLKSAEELFSPQG